MTDAAASVCFGRAHRFSAVIAEEAAIWDLSVEIAGVPDSRSGMVMSLPFVDQCLREAASEMRRGSADLEAIANGLSAKIKESGTEPVQVKVVLDCGSRRQVLLGSGL